MRRKLPAEAAAYRKRCELTILRDWLDAVPPSARVLDVGCGIGQLGRGVRCAVRVSDRDRSEPGYGGSGSCRRLAPTQNVSVIVTGDVLSDLPNESFDLIFVGGLSHVPERRRRRNAPAVARSLTSRLRAGGTIILRSRPCGRGRRVARGEYQAVYRSVSDYRRLISARGRWRSAATSATSDSKSRPISRIWFRVDTGSIVWRVARAITPLTFILLPRHDGRASCRVAALAESLLPARSDRERLEKRGLSLPCPERLHLFSEGAAMASP